MADESPSRPPRTMKFESAILREKENYQVESAGIRDLKHGGYESR
jgi:hypothetical protein